MSISFSTDSTSQYCHSADKGNLNFADDVISDEPKVESFEIDRCVAWIDDHNFKKIALQFPDNLLCISDEFALSIQRRLNDALVYILADTSYGSCCVDEVTAEHVNSDALIHFGTACLTPCNRLPVLYVFGNSPVDCQHVASQFSSHFPDNSVHVIFAYDVIYSHASNEIYELLKENYPDLRLSRLIIPGNDDGSDSPTENWFKFCGRKLLLPLGTNEDIVADHTIFYVGQEGPTLSNLMMTLNRCTAGFVVYDPGRREIKRESVNSNRALQKRYYLIERARDARLVGILVGTLGVSGYLDIIERVKRLAKASGKKSYTIAVGRINPAKLANFPEIDVFVLVACAENSMLDCKEFFKPIVTPFEFEMACNEARQWTGTYVTDFRQLILGAKHYVELEENMKPEDIRTSMSLISGKMNMLSTRSDSEEDRTGGSLLLTDSTVANIHNNASGDFLMQRSWRGLEQNLGKDEAARVRQGQSGIASAYNDEGKCDTK